MARSRRDLSRASQNGLKSRRRVSTLATCPSNATESDLFELFNGVGHVQNAEVVSYRHNQRSKGFAFVQMQTVEEAQRAVEELHDKEFLGRRLVCERREIRSAPAALGRENKE